MENILMVTDFSKASVNAGKYGIAFAKHMHAKVHLLHVYEPPVEIPESYLIYPPEQIGEQAMELLNKELETINEDKMADIEAVVAGGITVSDTILSEAKRLGADIIICGMKGAGGILKRVFGSTATALVRKSTIPLIIVPEGIPFRIPEKILLASDMNKGAFVSDILVLKQIGEIFHSKLSVVTVISHGETDTLRIQSYYTDLFKELSTLHPDLQLLIGDYIPGELEKFITQNHTDLLTMIPHKHSFLERVFGGSNTIEMTFLSGIPLLILPENNAI